LKKRLCAAFLAGLLAFSTVPVSAAGTDMKLNFSYPDGLSPGDTFSVEVQCTDNPGLCSFMFALAFDQKVLECTNIGLGPLLKDMMIEKNISAPSGAKIVGASAFPTEDDGALATFHFKVLSAGDYKFKICDYTFKDVEGNALPMTATFSSVSSGGTSTGGSSSSGSSSGSVSGGSSSSDSSAPEAADTPVFTDAMGHWAEDYILEAAERGLAAGVGNNLYGCEMSLTRAQFVTMLWANAGKPKGESSTFTDLSQDWYRDAVNWAAANGYVAGYEDNTFRPETKITREQVAVILRSMWFKAGNTPGMEQLWTSNGVYDAAFADSANISLWAKDAVYWAHYQRIWCGTEGLLYGEHLIPKAEATRAQFAVMLVRFLDL